MMIRTSTIQVYKSPTSAVTCGEWICTINGHSQLGYSTLLLGVGSRIGPRPGRRHHRIETDVADLIVQQLVNMTMQYSNLVNTLEFRLHLFSIFSPEIPWLEYLVQR